MRPMFLTALVLLAAPALGQEMPATLRGQAVMPAATFTAPPADAPPSLQVSGKYTAQGSVERIEGTPGEGTTAPFQGQPLQGFSGIVPLGEGRFLVTSDNGFGAKNNSADAMLAVHEIRPDFAAGTVDVERTMFLRDPDGVARFPIVTEASAERYLTGADFDIEGVQVVGDSLVLGDEFGPFILVVDRATGILREVHGTVRDGLDIRSPDHPALRLPDPGGALPAYGAKRSRGYEGLALSSDGTHVLGLLEGPLWNAETGDWQRTEDGREALAILEMDAATRSWTGRHWLYPVEGPGHAIGDFQMLDATRGIVIERDNGQGDAELACKDGATTGCQKAPALFKRIYMIRLGAPGTPVEKLGHIDLLNLRDPDGIARLGRRDDGTFRFPFVTIENVARVDDTHLIVINDNNFPFSTGRDLTAPDATEVILVEAGEFLRLGLAP